MRLWYTDNDSVKLLIKDNNPYKLDDKLKDYIDTSNFPCDTVFPLEPGKKKRICMFKIWKWRMSMWRI